MKILERIALVLFSIIIIVLAVTCCLVLFDLVELKIIFKYLEELFIDDIFRKVVLGASIIGVVLAIKSLFFPTRMKKKQEIKSGVLLENKDGRLLISKDTIENLVNSVVKSFEDAENTQTKIVLDANNNITVYVSMMVREESIIKDLTLGIQNKIKEAIKRSTDLDVNQVNINVKDIESSKNNQAKIRISNLQTNKNLINENETEENNKVEERKIVKTKNEEIKVQSDQELNKTEESKDEEKSVK